MACGAMSESLPVLNAGELGAGLPAYRGVGQIVFGSNRDRHCERSEAIQGNVGRPRFLDCFVAALLAMTATFLGPQKRRAIPSTNPGSAACSRAAKRAQMRNQPRGRRIERARVRSRIGDDRRQTRSKLLAELDAPLVKGIDVPNGAFREHLVFVERDEPPEHAWVEAAVEKRARRTAAGKALVRRKASGVSLARALLAGQRVGLFWRAAAHQGLALREAIGDQKIVMMRVGFRRRRRDEEV